MSNEKDSVVFIESDIKLNDVLGLSQYIINNKLITVLNTDFTVYFDCEGASWDVSEYVDYVKQNKYSKVIEDVNDILEEDIDEYLIIVDGYKYDEAVLKLNEFATTKLSEINKNCISLYEVYRLKDRRCNTSLDCEEEEVCDEKTGRCQKNIISRLLGTESGLLGMVRGYLTESEDIQTRLLAKKFEGGIVSKDTVTLDMDKVQNELNLYKGETILLAKLKDRYGLKTIKRVNLILGNYDRDTLEKNLYFLLTYVFPFLPNLEVLDVDYGLTFIDEFLLDDRFKDKFKNIKNKDGNTLLTIGVKDDNPEAIRWYLEKGIDPNIRNNEGKTALFYVKSVEVAKLLLDAGAEVNIRDNDGHTAIEWEIKWENLDDITMLLLKNGADINNRTKDGINMLMRASMRGMCSVVKFLLENGARVNLTDNRGHTALHVASSEGFSHIVELLLEHGADTDIQNYANQTALHFASAKNKPSIVELLLEHGADTDIIDKRGKTALDYARERGYSMVIEKFEKESEL